MVDRIIGSSRNGPGVGGNPQAPAPPGKPLKLVIDTNLWLDLLVFGDPSTARLAALPADEIRIFATGTMRAELADVITRPQFRLDTRRREQVLAAFDTRVETVATALDSGLACTDRDDLKFLDLGVAQRADWLLSRDRAVLAARKAASRRFGLRIGRLPDFYNWLDLNLVGSEPPHVRIARDS